MPSAKEQLTIFKRFLLGSQFPIDHPVFGKTLEFLKLLPVDFKEEERLELRILMCRAFGLTDEELTTALVDVKVSAPPSASETVIRPAVDVEADLWKLLPKEGYLHDYCTYTLRSEAPLAYHLYCAIFLVGAVMNRRVWIDMGFYPLYPAMAMILLGPSGIKKTSAANIALKILRDSELNTIFSEKLTPEALAKAVQKTPCGVVYAPELSVFLGKQKYMEGIVPLLTRLMDHPDTADHETVGGGVVKLREIGTSILGCSTPDWFIENTPEDTFGGGFVARFILNMQDDSPRVEPRPVAPPPFHREKLLWYLHEIFNLTGEMHFSKDADALYHKWYIDSKPQWKHPEIELMATFYNRKADHVQRMAMSIHLIEHRTMEICEECFRRAQAIIDWSEVFLIPLFKRMFRSTSGAEQEFLLRILRSVGGVIDHSSLVRKVQYRMSSQQLKNLLSTLIDAKIVDERKDKLQHVYILLER